MSKKRRTYDVLVTNLPPHVTEKSLSPLFTELGEVNSITIRSGRRHGGPRTAYVQYLCEPDADTAVDKLNGHCFEGHPLVVSRFGKEKSAQQGAARSSLTVNDLYAAIGKASNVRIPMAGPRMQLSSSSAPSSAEETLLVCHIKDVTSFYGQRLEDAARAVELNREVEEFCRSSPHLGSETPDFNKLYGCRFSEDNAWYRCKVLKLLDNSQSFVQYVDFGNCEAVQSGELVALRGDLTMEPPLALCYRLDGLFGVRRDEDPALYAQAMHKIGEMVADQCVCVQTKKATAAGMHFIVRCRLERSGLDLGEELIQLGYAKAAGPLSGPSVPNGSGGRGGRPQGSSLPGWQPWGNYPSWGQRPLHLFSDRQETLSPLRFVSADEEVSGLCIGQRGGGYGATARASQPPSQPGRGASREVTSSAVHAAKSEAMRQKQPQSPRASAPQSPPVKKEELSARLQEQEAKNKALAEEVTELRAARTENSFQLRLSKVLKLTEEALQQRDQLSTEPSRSDCLQRAADALTACREAASMLLNTREVEDNLARFQRAQDDVRACRDKDAVKGLAEERNDARSCLEASLRRFVAEADQLSSRVDQEPSATLGFLPGNAAIVCLGQEALKDLERVFQPFLDATIVPLSESALSLEELWAVHEQNKKTVEAEFQAKRRETDVAESHLKGALEMLEEALCLSSAKCPSRESFSPTFLEACLSNLHHSLASEVEACNLVGSPHFTTLSLLCHRLKKELSDTLERILNVDKEQTRYTELLRSLRPHFIAHTSDDGGDFASEWRRVEAMVEAVMEKKRHVRQLKSQLRHSLVDMDDVEPRDGEEWKAAAEAVSNLRNLVLSAFAEEDALMQELMKLQAEHFPELVVLHPELELESYSRHKGLVKSSWELCAFCITEKRQDPHTGSWYRAANGNEQVLIKKYVVDSEGTREELLSWALEWSQLSCKHLLPLQAAFLSKDGRTVYLQVPWREGCSLAAWDGALSSKLLGEVLEAVLQSLAALHTVGKAHGGIHPSAILLPEGCEGQVLLDLPNFMATEGRLKAVHYPPLNGLGFRAPELLTGEGAASTPEGDMYALGCLLLWMCFPNTRFQPTAEGTPSFAGTSSPPLGDLVFSIARELLNADPKARPTANYVLGTKLFLHLATAGTSEDTKNTTSATEETDEIVCDTPIATSVLSSATVMDDMTAPQFEENPGKVVEGRQIVEVDESIAKNTEGQKVGDDNQTMLAADTTHATGVHRLLPRGIEDGIEVSASDLSCVEPMTSTMDLDEDHFSVCQDDSLSKTSSAVTEVEDLGASDIACGQESFYDGQELSCIMLEADSGDIDRGSSGDDAASKLRQPRPRSRLLLNLELLQSETEVQEASSGGATDSN